MRCNYRDQTRYAISILWQWDVFTSTSLSQGHEWDRPTITSHSIPEWNRETMNPSSTGDSPDTRQSRQCTLGCFALDGYRSLGVTCEAQYV